MRRDNVYRYVGNDPLIKMRTAIVFKDYFTLAKTLKSIKLNKADFIELCKTSVEANDQFILNSLLEAYYQFWKQDVFEAIIVHISKEKKYELASYIDEFIDKVNTRFSDVNAWESYVKSKEDAVLIAEDTQQIKSKKSFLSKLRDFINLK